MPDTEYTSSLTVRLPYGHGQLHRLIAPDSIAVVGASEKAGSFGQRTLDNIRIGYTGRLYPVNPGYERIAGMVCHAALEDLPEVPDCVVVVVPMAQVESVVRSAARLGAGGLVIYSAGFGETGDDDAVQTQERIVALATAARMPVLGPNCLGLVNMTRSLGLTFMPKFNEMRHVAGRIGLVSQSGALGYCVMQAMERGIGFSHFLSAGNSADVDVCDLVNYLVDDPATDVIACMFEGVRDGARFLHAARRALQAGKPLLVYKLANCEISRRTALSHTGTLAGSTAAYRAAFDHAGVVVVDDWEELLEAAVYFSKAPPPRVPGIGVMASSGGAAVMAADKAEEFGLSLPAPAAQTADRLRRAVPGFGSTANPCDLTAESLKVPQMYTECIRAFADDPAYAAVVVPMMSAQAPTTVDRAQSLSALAGTLSKPMCLVWLNEWLTGPGSEVYEASPHITLFRSMRRCMKVLRAWLDYHRLRPGLLAPAGPRQAATAAADLVWGFAGRTVLSESESKRVLAAWDIPVTQEVLVADAAAAVRAARSIGYPVALKIDSADIPHKTEAGVVRLGVSDDAAVESACAALLAAVDRLPERPDVRGILVQQMAPSGVELMIGARMDAQFGPLVLCGFGGVDVELMQDVAVALAPVSEAQARQMLLSLRRAPLLTGYRKLPRLDLEAAAQALSRLSSLASDLRSVFSEIDVNPLCVAPRGVMAADALLVFRENADFASTTRLS